VGLEARASPAAKPASSNLGNNLLGIRLIDAFAQRLEPILAQVLVKVDRVDSAAMFGGDADLLAQEIGDMAFPHVNRVASNRLASLVGEDAVQNAGDGIGNLFCHSGHFEVAQDNVLGVLRLDSGVQEGFAAGQNDFEQRRLVAHSDASNAFDRHLDTCLCQGVIEGFAELAAAAGHTTRAESDAYLAT
jgi:hypothetical protein